MGSGVWRAEVSADWVAAELLEEGEFGEVKLLPLVVDFTGPSPATSVSTVDARGLLSPFPRGGLFKPSETSLEGSIWRVIPLPCTSTLGNSTTPARQGSITYSVDSVSCTLRDSLSKRSLSSVCRVVRSEAEEGRGGMSGLDKIWADPFPPLRPDMARRLERRGGPSSGAIDNV